MPPYGNQAQPCSGEPAGFPVADPVIRVVVILVLLVLITHGYPWAP